ncbi:LWR-salt protein [Halosolutus gelatinilyticus]|uniref:LWR-salt protein n=1 Tax=Halosolutus gelatinilyticus TaxID=2931975 RepID=UPI001FF29FD2|nr:LWR-salt protein [Halosolutus gelatinilyticus]
MEAQYVFRATLRLASPRDAVTVDSATAETTVTLSRAAPPPGTDGWLFFRNALWRGEVGDQEYGRRLAAEWLDVPRESIESVSFRELQVDEAYFDALKAEIGADLEPFNAETVSEVLSKYLGSSIRVVDGE